MADALARATRPIPLDERLLPRTLDGDVSRRRFERGDFPPARPAATLLAIYPDAAGDLVVPLTVRHTDLRAHAGEVSLPGGAVDATDAGPEAAALREAWEEVGLQPDDVRIVGVARPGVDPGQQLRDAPVCWHGRRAANRSCHMTRR